MGRGDIREERNIQQYNGKKKSAHSFLRNHFLEAFLLLFKVGTYATIAFSSFQWTTRWKSGNPQSANKNSLFRSRRGNSHSISLFDSFAATNFLWKIQTSRGNIENSAWPPKGSYVAPKTFASCSISAAFAAVTTFRNRTSGFKILFFFSPFFCLGGRAPSGAVLPVKGEFLEAENLGKPKGFFWKNLLEKFYASFYVVEKR